MKTISSKENPVYRAFRKLAEKPGQVSLREGFLLEGEKLIREAIRAGARVQALFLGPSAESDWAGCEDVTYALPDGLLKGLSSLPTPAGVIAAVSMERGFTLERLLEQGDTFLALDRIQDPGNLGTILRTAEGLGVEAVFLLPGCCSPANPKVLRAAMGSAFRVPVIEELSGTELLALCRKQGITPVATAMDGTPLPSFPFAGKILLFMGNEGQGLDPALISGCQARIAIPQKTAIESFNVAVATAICLYERRRQR